MNTKLKYWILACRPHTLPLAISGIGLGNILAYQTGTFDWKIFVFSILTATLLQILSNLANDYGDSKHGSDNSSRIGPERAVQSGIISAASMKKASIGVAIGAFVSGSLLLFFSRHVIGWTSILILLGLGLIAIWSAFGYTASNKPYGYKGLGDLFVFLFFGLIAVCGSFYLQNNSLNVSAWFAAIAIGLFSTAVLNLNNMRDIKNEKASGKITLAVRLGIIKAKHYHSFLIGFGILFSLFFLSSYYNVLWQWWFTTPLFLVGLNIYKVYRVNDSIGFYPLLKQLSLAVLFFVLSLGIGFILIK
ncbi:MAG: 1,4-dihydroxy-2-naphthoate octaprenyltransferase [Bacteroidetes bacterium]|nr:1,4-dihydroxy-2-naphthoate octaprenyltransferase [Bacteroidota bacterium]